MDKAEMKGELEEEVPLLEGLLVRRRSKSPTRHNLDYIEEDDMKNVDVNDGGVDDLVYAPPEEVQSSDCGGLEVSQDELKEKEEEEEVDSKSLERFVYYQNDEGLWKCRKCCWTCQGERVSSDDIQNSKQPLQKPTHFHTVNQQGSCFSYETEGTGCTGGQLSSGQSSMKHTGQDEIQGERILDVTKQSSDIGQHLRQESKVAHEKQLEHESLSSSNFFPSEISPEEDNKNFEFSTYKEIGSGDTSRLHETDQEATDVDVERVLREQETHDLYCPNCKSCITKRVIIRKRKRTLPYSSEDSKRNKLEEGTGSDPVSASVATTRNPSPGTVDSCLDGSAAPTSNNYDKDQEPDVFGCLSCFSIFIPAGNGFKLLGISGDRRHEDNLQDNAQTPIEKIGWFFTLFQSDRNVETDDTEVLIPTVSEIHEYSSHAQTNYRGEPVKTGAEGSTEGGTNNSSHQKNCLGKPGGKENLEDQFYINMNKQNGDASGDEAPSHTIFDDGEIVQSEMTGCDTDSVCSRELSDTLLIKNKGNGFKLLGMSGGRRDNVKLHYHPQTSIVKKSWFSTLFQSQKNIETDDTEVPVPKVSATHESSSHAQTNYDGDPVKTRHEGLTEGGTNNLPHQKVCSGKHGGKENLEDQLYMNMNKQNGDASGDEAPSHTIYDDGEIVQIEISGSKEGCDKVLSHSSKRFIEIDIHLAGSGELSNTSLSKDKVGDEITVETCQVEQLAAQRVQDLTEPAESGNLQNLETRIQINEQRGTSTEGIQGVEIIKSIVYGGLVESVTSLGVVSSAASSKVTTLNVFALGLANLIGGLFIIGHNLLDLKNDQKTEASDQSDKQIDKYHELLGQRRNFLLHAVLAILSYLIFGLLPPVVYGFSFQKSDNRDLKLLAAATVSLLGIIILAAGKAYVQRAPRSYVKTVAYYVVTALMTSGASYAAGDLINMFLEKFGVFQSSSVVTLPETLGTEPGWTSF
ncbi:membrane protein of ER body-like protein [Apium graveolens]|uniref:membrane protein of ER body-like protein n=1 Tax=Apium graveolens TaxID=4045 RepID=UPI003D7BE8B1